MIRCWEYMLSGGGEGAKLEGNVRGDGRETYEVHIITTFSFSCLRSPAYLLPKATREINQTTNRFPDGGAQKGGEGGGWRGS